MPDLLWETSLRVKVPTVNQANFEFAIQASPARFGRTNLQAEQDERDAGGQLAVREEAPRRVELRVEQHGGDAEHEEDEVHDEVGEVPWLEPPGLAPGVRTPTQPRGPSEGGVHSIARRTQWEVGRDLRSREAYDAFGLIWLPNIYFD